MLRTAADWPGVPWRCRRNPVRNRSRAGHQGHLFDPSKPPRPPSGKRRTFNPRFDRKPRGPKRLAMISHIVLFNPKNDVSAAIVQSFALKFWAFGAISHRSRRSAGSID